MDDLHALQGNSVELPGLENPAGHLADAAEIRLSFTPSDRRLPRATRATPQAVHLVFWMSGAQFASVCRFRDSRNFRDASRCTEARASTTKLSRNSGRRHAARMPFSRLAVSIVTRVPRRDRAVVLPKAARDPLCRNRVLRLWHASSELQNPSATHGTATSFLDGVPSTPT